MKTINQYLLESIQVSNIKDLVKLIKNNPDNKKIFITGISGSGKSTIATKLLKYFPTYNLISLDKLTFDEIENKYKRDWITEKDTDKRMEIFGKLTKNIFKKYQILNSNKNMIIEGSHLLEPSNSKYITHNVVVYVSLDVNTILKRRTDREIKKKEEKLGRKLTSEELKKKLDNSRSVVKYYIPLVKSFIKQVNPIIYENNK